jgi:hypothetical protein
MTSRNKKIEEVYLFVGYPKGTRGGLFYSPRDKKIFC